MDDIFNNNGGLPMKWFVFLSAIFLLLSGCDSGGDGNVSPQRPSVAITGTAFDGLVYEGEITIYTFDSGNRGAVLGTGVTNLLGEYNVEIQSANRPIMVCVVGGQDTSGGYYVEESSGATVYMKDSDELCLVQMYTGAPISSSITFFTNIARGLAEYLVTTGMETEEAINRANSRVSTLLDMDILSTFPKDITSIQNATPFSTPSHVYGFATASISQWTQYVSSQNEELNVHDFYNSILFSQKAYEDIVYDGVLNGQSESGLLNMGTVPITTESYRHVLVENMFTIANSPRNATGLDASDLYNIGLVWNNSSDTMFGGTPPVDLNTTQPTITNVSINEGQVLFGDAVVFSADVSDVYGLNSVVLRLDGNDLQVFTNGDPVTHTLDTTQYPDGDHVLSIVATNAFDGEFTVDVNVTFANRRTTIANINPADGSFVRGTFSLTADVSDPLGIDTTSLFVDDSLHSNAENATSPAFQVNSSAFNDGVHNFRITATNGVGFDTDTAMNYTVDNTLPTASLNNIADGGYISGIPSIGISVFDNLQLSQAQLRLNGEVINTYTDFSITIPPYNFNTTAIPDSSVTLALTATDQAGNNAVHSIGVTVDNNPPTVTIDSPSADSYQSADFDILATVSDTIGVETTEYFVDGNLNDSITVTLNGMTDGVHSIAVTATDFAGHQDSATLNVTVDTTRPVVAITNPVVDTTRTEDFLIAADITDTTPIVSTQFMVDNTVLPTALVNVDSLTDGTHLAKVIAVDSVGLETTAEVSFNTDTTDPEVSVDLQSGQRITTPDTVTVNATVTDALGIASVEFHMDGNLLQVADLADLSTIFLPTELADGDHTFTVIAIDNSGFQTVLDVPFVVSFPPPSMISRSFTDPNVALNDGQCRFQAQFDGPVERIASVEVWQPTLTPPNILKGEITGDLVNNGSGVAVADITFNILGTHPIIGDSYFRIYNYAGDYVTTPINQYTGDAVSCFFWPASDNGLAIFP